MLVHSEDRIVFANPSCVKLLCAETSEQLIGTNIYNLVHPDFRAAVQRRNSDCYNKLKTTLPIENKLLALDGSAIPTESTATLICWNGAPALEVVLRDIRGRKRVEETLREYERLVEGVEDMVVVIDRDFRFVIANRAFLDYRGLTRKQVIGRPVSEFLDEGAFDRIVESKLKECFAGKIVKYELTNHYPELGERDLFVSYFPIENAGRVTGAACVLRDITDRKRRAREDQKWQKRIELAEQAGLRLGLWDWDLTSNTVIWSDESYRQFGFTPTLVSGRLEDGFHRVHPEDQARVATAIHSVLIEGAPEYNAQYRVLRPDGSIRWIDAHGVVLRGDAAHMIGVGVDITHLKNTEQSLKESEERYLLLLNSTAEAIYGLDVEGNCTFCNLASCRLLGFGSSADLLGRNMHEVVHHTHADGTASPEQECQIYQAFLHHQSTHVTDEIFWRADGTSFPVEYWSYPMWKDGEIIGSVVTFLDISDRQQSELALRQSEEKYRQLFENSPYGIFRSSFDGILLDVNPALVAMLGYDSKEELMSRTLEQDIYVDPAERRAAIEMCRTHGRVDGMEFKWKRRDGTVFDVRNSGRMIQLDDKNPPEMEVIVDDITGRNILQQQLRQAQKMESVGRLGIAHDFNNLLMVIQSYTELLQESLPVGDVLRQRTHEVMKATERAASLTGQLLAFSRKQITSPVLLKLNAIITETAKMLKRVIGEDIEFRVSLSDSPGFIHADPDQIVQILMNLCVNARDAMPRGGILTIATQNVTVGEGGVSGYPFVVSGEYVMLSVTDTGIGMSDEVKEQIFEPFFTTKDVGKGTGLGLSMVYGIAKQSGGYVWAESVPGQGAHFMVYLPRVKKGCTPRIPARASASPRGTETLLVVEDEDALRDAICDYLRGMGYTVVAAGSGRQALEKVGQYGRRIDMLITDVVMPKMSGRELSETLGRFSPDLRTLFMSGYTDDSALRHGIRDLSTTFLQKPFPLDHLARKVRDVLG